MHPMPTDATMTIDFSNTAALDADTRQSIIAALNLVTTASFLFPEQRTLLPSENFFDDAELTIALTTDAGIQDLNKTWRGKDSATSRSSQFSVISLSHSIPLVVRPQPGCGICRMKFAFWPSMASSTFWVMMTMRMKMQHICVPLSALRWGSHLH